MIFFSNESTKLVNFLHALTHAIYQEEHQTRESQVEGPEGREVTPGRPPPRLRGLWEEDGLRGRRQAEEGPTTRTAGDTGPDRVSYSQIYLYNFTKKTNILPQHKILME